MPKMNIFERAARSKLRFQTVKGLLAAEQLFDMPLVSQDGFNLDETAQNVATDLETIKTKSFVKRDPNERVAENTLRLEILKHIISTRLEENEAATQRERNRQRKQRLLAALEAKEGEELASMDRDEILAEIEALSA